MVVFNGWVGDEIEKGWEQYCLLDNAVVFLFVNHVNYCLFKTKSEAHGWPSQLSGELLVHNLRVQRALGMSPESGSVLGGSGLEDSLSPSAAAPPPLKYINL